MQHVYMESYQLHVLITQQKDIGRGKIMKERQDLHPFTNQAHSESFKSNAVDCHQPADV